MTHSTQQGSVLSQSPGLVRTTVTDIFIVVKFEKAKDSGLFKFDNQDSLNHRHLVHQCQAFCPRRSLLQTCPELVRNIYI